MIITRRGFTIGLIAAIAAPAIVRPGLIMPIKPSLVPISLKRSMSFVINTITQRDDGSWEFDCLGLINHGHDAKIIDRNLLRHVEERVHQDVVMSRNMGSMRPRLIAGMINHELRFVTDDLLSQKVLREAFLQRKVIQVESGLLPIDVQPWIVKGR